MKKLAALTSIENGAQLSINHSANFTYIEAALKSHWPSLIDLAKKIQSFSPKPIEEFASEKEGRLEFFRQCAPSETTDAQIIDAVNKQIELLAREDFQYFMMFDSIVATEYVKICILSQALCEALVNYFLAIGLTKARKTDTFKNIEKKTPFIKKWTEQLPILWPQYELPESSNMHITLTKLISQRNSLIHGKISLDASNGESISSPEFEREDFHEEINWMTKFMNIPFDLAEHFRLITGEGIFSFILHDRTPIEKIDELLEPY